MIRERVRMGISGKVTGGILKEYLEDFLKKDERILKESLKYFLKEFLNN